MLKRAVVYTWKKCINNKQRGKQTSNGANIHLQEKKRTPKNRKKKGKKSEKESNQANKETS